MRFCLLPGAEKDLLHHGTGAKARNIAVCCDLPLGTGGKTGAKIPYAVLRRHEGPPRNDPLDQ